MQSAAAAAQSIVTAPEIELAKLHLQQTSDLVIGALLGVSDAQWRFKPANGAWSIAENGEHIIVVQERVLIMLREQLLMGPPPPPRDNQSIDSLIIDRFPNRLAKFQAPEFVHPKGDWTLAQTIDRMAANTRHYGQCLRSMPYLRAHSLESPPLKALTKGEHVMMDGYQWILAVCGHSERHVKQIIEVKADPAFPLG